MKTKKPENESNTVATSCRVQRLVGFVVCPRCKKLGNIKSRRLNTRFTDDSQNIFKSCRKCYDAEVEYYAELWSQIY